MLTKCIEWDMEARDGQLQTYKNENIRVLT